jgi:formate-dependent nitrite reductase membrane component NrfD
MWSEQLEGQQRVVSGNPQPSNSSAAAVLSYDVPHKAPWDWRVSLYTLTKGIAAGTYLVATLLLLLGSIDSSGTMWLWAMPLVSGLFLALTGGLLIWDLEQPQRFFMIFTRSHWKSWLVRGAYIIGGYSAVLTLHLLATLLGRVDLQQALLWVGVPLAVMTAIYTAYLFAQAKARDLWQNPLLAPHLLVQTIMAGAAALLPVSVEVEPLATPHLVVILAVASLIHLLMIVGEATLTHGTAHARLAAWEMIHGRFKRVFWIGSVLAGLTVLAPWLGPAVAAPVALLALLCYEHAYVQAGQAVPLA